MTILYTKRILSTSNDSNEISYHRIPGVIMNSMLDMDSNYTSPSLNSVRTPISPVNENHEIRVLVENATKSFYVDPNINQTVYYLPSLVFSFHNIISNKLSVLQPNVETMNFMQGEVVDSNAITNTYSFSLTENDTEYTIPLETDGVLSSVYEICFNNSYSDVLGYTHYCFTIGPYINSALTDEQMYPNVYSSSYSLNNIYSTREFEIGYDSNSLFTNVSLLVHGKLKEYTSSSPTIDSIYFENSNSLYADLFWIGITLFYTNPQNEVCTTANATSVHIRSTINSPYENAFQPYFAKRTNTVSTTPVQYQVSQRSQYGLSRGCPASTNTKIGYEDLYGNIYIGDGTFATKDTITERELMKVSNICSLTELVDPDQHIYIVLLPC